MFSPTKERTKVILRFMAAMFCACSVSARTPVILRQPPNQTVAQGASAKFTVTAISSSGPLHYQWTKDGAIIPGATYSAYVIPRVQPQNIGDYRVIVSSSPGTATSAIAMLNIPGVPRGIWRGLIAYYPFNGNSKDKSGNGHDGDAVNVVYDTDRFGHANSSANFSSGDAYVDIPSLNAMPYRPVTYSAWFKLNSYPTAAERRSDGAYVMTMVGRDLSGSQDEGALCLYGPPAPDNSINYLTGSTGTPGIQAATNVWTHVVFTQDASNHACYYFNGRLSSSAVFDAVQSDVIPFRIGASASFDDYRLGWKGSIDDVRIYNRALLPSEVSQLYLSEGPVTALAPSIQTQPQSVTCAVGATATFTVSTEALLPAVTSGTLRLWLKADAGVVTNSSGVVQWQDQSGNANNARANSAEVEPSLAYPSALGGRPVIRFDGIQDNVNGDYLHGSGDVGIPDAFTSFMVYNAFQTTNAENLLVDVGYPGRYYGECRINGFQTMSFSGWAYDYFAPYSIPTHTYRIWTDRVDTNLTQVEMFDTTPTTQTNFLINISGFLPPAAGYFIGGFDPSYQYVVKGRNFNGDLAEIIFYRGKLSEADRLAVQQYLMAKYFQSRSPSKYTYQWQFNGVDINGATNSSLTINNAGGFDVGMYDVVVCNGNACVTSSNATLTVEQP